jgi:protein SCO1
MKVQLTVMTLLVCMLLAPFSIKSASGHEATPADTPGIAEATGQVVPLDLTFLDEDGGAVRLKNLIKKPTILTLVYYSCSGVCPQMLGALASALGGVKLEPGKDYELVTISFDKDDTPAIAKEKKVNYIKATGTIFPADAWRFLTGGEESINLLTKAVGFNFKKDLSIRTVGFGSQKERKGFIHPAVLIFLAPDGKVTKYIYLEQSHYGTLSSVSFSSAEITAALIDTAKGKVRTGSSNPIRLCFPGISDQQERFYTLMSIIGAATLLCVMAFFIYLRKTSGQAGRGKGEGGGP